MNAWKDAVDELLSTAHQVAGDDPRESINRLVDWHVSVALDPAVSSDAQALVDKGRAELQARLELAETALLRRGMLSCETCGRWHTRQMLPLCCLKRPT